MSQKLALAPAYRKDVLRFDAAERDTATTLQDVLRFDAVVGILGPPIETEEGYLICEAFVQRSGVFNYPQPDGSVRREYRPWEEVSSPKSVRTYIGKPITEDHSGTAGEQLVSKETIAQDMIGFAGTDPTLVGNHLKTKLVFHKPEGVQALKAGKKEISPGILCDVEETPGVYNGQPYDAIQRNLRCNHIAICKAGRAGPTVAVRLDAASVRLDSLTEDSNMGVLFRGVRFDSIDAPELQHALATAEVDLKAADVLKGENAVLRTQVAAKAEVRLDAAALNAQLDERITLLGMAERIGMVDPRQHTNDVLKREIVCKAVPSLRNDSAEATIHGAYLALSASAAAPAPATPVVAATPATPATPGITYVESPHQPATRLDSTLNAFQQEMQKAEADHNKIFLGRS